MQGVEIGNVRSAVGARDASGVRLTSAPAIPSPLQEGQVRRIDWVIDYFGGRGKAAATSLVPRRRVTGGLERVVPEGSRRPRSACPDRRPGPCSGRQATEQSDHRRGRPALPSTVLQ
jgi:hypothetical protein